MDVVRKGVLIRSATKLGSGSNGISIGRKLNGSSTLPTITTRIVGTPKMVFTIPTMIIHVNRTANQPLMNSMDVGKYRNVNAMNPRRGYQEPFVVTTPIFIIDMAIILGQTR
jgi:hypothetical protein